MACPESLRESEFKSSMAYDAVNDGLYDVRSPKRWDTDHNAYNYLWTGL